eukprot:366537-Chlamydomonas_euryale.AAC.12
MVLVVYVKKHEIGCKPKIEAIVTTALNTVEELQDSLYIDDVAWLGSDGKWFVIYNAGSMKMTEFQAIKLKGDGKSPETCYEARKRIGGALAHKAHAPQRAHACMHACMCI